MGKVNPELERELREGYAAAIARLEHAGMRAMAESLRTGILRSDAPWDAAEELRRHARAPISRERRRALLFAAVDLDRLSGAYARLCGVPPRVWLTVADRQDAAVLGYAEPADYYAAFPEALARDPDCAICRLLPYGACDYHAAHPVA